MLANKFELSDEEFEQFRRIIYRSTGIHLSKKKKTLVISRLSKRLRALNLADFSQYYRYLKENHNSSDELVHMINRITTNKTEFFRERSHFDFLREDLLPHMIKKADKSGIARRLRIWSAGCSTGEEPYSIAMTIQEAFRGKQGWDIKILATDVDTEVLRKGITGVYSPNKVVDVPSEYLKRYFERQDDGYHVKEGIKSMVVFRRLNLIREIYPMKGPFDIIFCRNVIIYFDRDTKKRLMERFYQYLKDGGFIFMGHSESLMDMKDRFRYIKNTIYKKV